MSKILPLQRRGIPASRLALGCMGLGGEWDKAQIDEADVREAHAAIDAALEVGVNFFDHADIYGKGKAEAVFGRVLQERPGLRSQILLQTKCGIRFAEEDGTPERYDFSTGHILESVNGSLQRLGVEQLDLLLLHRPDSLMDPGEVAEAFDRLSATGKVRWFGVSNMSAGQIRLLRSQVAQPLVVNQLELSLGHVGWLDAGVHVNEDLAREDTFPEGTLEYCELEGIQLQAWGPLAQGRFSGQPLAEASEPVRATADLVRSLAEQHDTTREAIVLAWLLAHPAGIQPVVGTRSPERIRACARALDTALTRDEWYRLYVSSRGRPLP